MKILSNLFIFVGIILIISISVLWFMHDNLTNMQIFKKYFINYIAACVALGIGTFLKE
jgi:hypothetical protein